LLDATVQLRFPAQSKKHFGREEDRRDEDLEQVVEHSVGRASIHS
jgi:hypothetical protein